MVRECLVEGEAESAEVLGPMRVVVDANVILPGLGFVDENRVSCEIIMDLIEAGKISMCVSWPIVKEVGRVALRKMDGNFNVKKWERLYGLFERAVEFSGEMVRDLDGLLVDSTDRKYLDVLVKSGANWLVSSDYDLLELNKIYPVVTPDEFVMRPEVLGLFRPE